VFLLDAQGEVLDRFGEAGVTEASFFHTGRWQTWSADARFAYYTAGTLKHPQVVRRELASGAEETIDGDLEGASPADAPLLSGLLGMLHAAGDGTGRYEPEASPVPFQDRSAHGLFQHSFDPPRSRLALSVDAVLAEHPDRDSLLRLDSQVRAETGEGLSLMTYCVRWSPDGTRLLFYFGNHLAFIGRGEPRVAHVMTSTPDLRDLRVALRLGEGRPGVHWSWQPDGEHLIGYGPDPDDLQRMCLAEVRFDGTGYRRLSEHDSGGHPSVSHVDPDLIVTDEPTDAGGAVVFLSRRTGGIVRRIELPRFRPGSEVRGRSRLHVDHHPVFSPDGAVVHANVLPDEQARIAVLEAPR
jgi:hypothetical protein